VHELRSRVTAPTIARVEIDPSNVPPFMWNPCLACGACCAYFRAAFYWSEADGNAPGHTPSELTLKLGPHHAVMRGTEKTPPRCIALHGDIGNQVKCTIHPLRPSPCREFQPSWLHGVRNERCDRARAAHGLPPLEPP
jgi:Fe-S-cluster containining protein